MVELLGMGVSMLLVDWACLVAVRRTRRWRTIIVLVFVALVV